MGNSKSEPAKCEFVVYKGVSRHVCEEKRTKLHTFYLQGGALITNRLKNVNDPQNYHKATIRVQAKCVCPNTVRLSVAKRVATSIYFKPGAVYNYIDKIVVVFDCGFHSWLLEQTSSIRRQSPLVASFVEDLKRGITFYDGGYLRKALEAIGET